MVLYGSGAYLMVPNRYKVFSIDLTVAHTDEPVDLADVLDEAGVQYAKFLSILAVPSAFQFKLNSVDNDAVSAVVGLEWEFDISAIFITNIVAVGTALINVEYRVD